MDAKTLFENFGLIASAPNGVEQLRRMIFQLAVQGKLSSRIDSDSLAHDNFKKLNFTKNQLYIAPQSSRFNTPSHWITIQLGYLMNLVNGRAFKSTEWSTSGLPIIRIQNLNDKNAPFNYFSGEVDEKHLVQDGDLLISWSGTPGTSFGAFTWHEGDAVLNQHIFKITLLSEELNRDYIRLSVNTLLPTLIEQSSGATGIKHLKKSTIQSLAIPLPPKEEQVRVVFTVKRLLAICERLEALNEKRENLQKKAKVIFKALETTQTFDERVLAWQRISRNSTSILDTPDLQTLIGTLGTLALQGKLTKPPQCSENDFYFNQIKVHTQDVKNTYVEQKWIRRQRPVSSRFIVEHGFPESWPIAALDDIAIVMGGITKGRNLKDKEIGKFLYLRVANVQRGWLDLDDVQEIWIARDEFDKYSLHHKDLLVAEGGDWDKVGRAALWNDEVPYCVHQNHILKVRAVSDLLLPEWLEFVFNSPYGKSYFSTASKKTTNLASINMTQLKSFPCPIPSLAEQQSILDKMNNIQRILTKHHSQQVKKLKKHNILAKELIRSMTGIELSRGETMEAPKTEVITELSTNQVPDKSEDSPLFDLLQKENGKFSAKTLWLASDFGETEINQFYQQLRNEMHKGWITQGEVTVNVEQAEDKA